MLDICTLKKDFSKRVHKEITENILPFWITYACDFNFGGFYGRITNDLKIDKRAPKGSVLCARILWSYSAAYRKFKDKKYLDMAERAYHYLMSNLWDKQYSGVYWMADYKGSPLDEKKQIFAQAYTIYGLAEYHKATGYKESLEKAVELFYLIEKHSRDEVNEGYFEACTREWKLSKDLRLSEEDKITPKSMNTHMHVLEGYTNLYEVWKNETLKERLKTLMDITTKHIIDRENWHLRHYFAKDWSSTAGIVSYGHDIEGSWLLYKAAEVLGDEQVKEKVKQIAISMAEVTFKEGLDNNFGVLNVKYEDGRIDREKHWWPQTEAIIGFLNAYELSRKEYFLEAAYYTWCFIEENIVDKVHGEWFWLAPDGLKHHEMAKVDLWKCPYHNSRACFEALERLERLEK